MISGCLQKDFKQRYRASLVQKKKKAIISHILKFLSSKGELVATLF